MGLSFVRAYSDKVFDTEQVVTIKDLELNPDVTKLNLCFCQCETVWIPQF